MLRDKSSDLSLKYLYAFLSAEFFRVYQAIFDKIGKIVYNLCIQKT